MKISTFASVTIVGSTLAGSLMLSPVRPQPTVPATPAALTLPFTGSQVAIGRIRHATDLEAPMTPSEIYEQYVPPPPPPLDPAPAPVLAAASRVWTPPTGYVTIGVPISQQAMTLDCETSALPMGLATFAHYYTASALFAYANPNTPTP